MIKFDFSTYTKEYIDDDSIKHYEAMIPNIKTSLGNTGYMGWYDIEKMFAKDLVNDINTTASFIRDNCDVFLVMAVGGSFLGSFAAIEALNPYFYNDQKTPKIYFLGNNFSSDYYHNLIDIIKDKRIIINVISKSGTTLETLIAYQLIMPLIKQKYDEQELKKRIIITTVKEHGDLTVEAQREGYKSFDLPEGIGGRYSVFLPVGLLPMAVSNINLEELYKGAKEANDNLDNQIRYAIIRKSMYDKGKTVEAFVVYEPKLYSFTEWLKQLYSESLGKKGQGILPISLVNTRDLHSLGQFVQQGNKILFETVFNVNNCTNNIMVEKYSKSLNDINNIASRSTSMAHLKGGVLNNIIDIEELNEKTLGYLFQFFMISCVISSYLENVNPFDQEGVSEYKNIMAELLKK